MTINISNQTFPTYLKQFLGDTGECILVYKKKTSTKSESDEFNDEWSFSSNLKQLNLDNVSIESDLELTGNPLKVDLDESVMVTLSTISAPQSTPSWTIGESHHYSINLDEARTLLNSKFNHEKPSLPVFCLTNGNDSQKTVVLGAHYTGRSASIYSGHVIGYLREEDEKLNLENMKGEHEKYTRNKADVNYNFKRIYNINDFNMQEIPVLEYSKCHGSMHLETSWKVFSIEEPNVGETELKMVLKVISGHKESPVNYLWNQLSCLEKYLGVLINEEVLNDGNTLISEDGLSISDLTDQIHIFCHSNLIKKRKPNENSLNFKNLKKETILDKLWMLFNRCQNLKDLKNFISIFFTVAKTANFSGDGDVLAGILEKSLENSDFVSNLTYPECLKLLVYIGFEKLKQDYFEITNFYCPIHQVSLEKTWCDFNQKDQKYTRRTVSRGIKHSNFYDTTFNESKMDFLMKLHNVAEILAFLKEGVQSSSKLSSDNFSLICKHIFEKYFLKKAERRPRLKVELLDINCHLSARNDEVYKDKIPETSVLQFSSRVGKSNIRTIFHICQHPIFPKCIYDSYEMVDESRNSNDEEEPWHMRYLTKMVILQ